MKPFRRILALACLLLCAAAARADVLTLPDAVTEIAAEAFMNDAALDEAVLPDGLKRIESKAFASSGLQRVYLPESL